MKKFLKALLGVFLVLALWVGMFLAIGLNLGDLVAWGMAERYEYTESEEHEVVLMGSSTMFKWEDSQRALAPLDTINVGIGGSVVSNWCDWNESLVYPFSPDTVVIYVGANDLHGSKLEAELVFESLKELFGQIHEKLPDADIYYISVYTTGAYPELKTQDEELNRLTAQLAETSDYLHFIDCDSALKDENGAPRTDVFASDLVHLSDEGYRIWTETVREALAEKYPELAEKGEI